MNIPYKNLYEKIVLIRKFENRLIGLFSEGKLFGTTHTYVGQEAIAVSVISQLNDNDTVFSNHRCHGHYLAKEDDPRGLLGEIMGREIGTCSGRGGSQHLCRNNFFSNGIQGGFLPNALGMAFSEKYNGSSNIIVAFIGDGTMGEGSVYETMNLASLWRVPLLIVVENNQYAQTTPIDANLAGSITKRAEAFDISTGEIESNDVKDLYPLFEKIISKVREDKLPHLQVVNTYRHNAHSKGDDYRDAKEIEQWKKKDPLIYFEDKLSSIEREKIESSVNQRLRSIEKEVIDSPFSSFNN
jgi:TPP-dependent pyruvate/acetoin dehydrogenase alpha subunit